MKAVERSFRQYAGRILLDGTPSDLLLSIPSPVVSKLSPSLQKAFGYFTADYMQHKGISAERILNVANGDAQELLPLFTDLVAPDGIPPMPDIEKRIKEGISRFTADGAGQESISAVEDPLERKTLFENVTVDAIIPPSGFLRDYVDYFSEQTDAPRLFHLVLGYITLAVVVGNRAYFTLAGDRLFPNLWAVVIGPSGSSRKSTSLNKSRGLVSAIDPKAVFPGDFTTEALLDILSANPQGVFYHSEFRALYGMLEKDYMSGAKALLTEMYDSPRHYRRETKGKTCAIDQPVISMASATTTQWLTSRRNADDDFGGGFLARFLFVPVFKRERSLPLPPAPDGRRFAALVQLLRKFRENSLFPVEAHYSPAAREMFIDWYQKFDKIDPFADTPLAPFHARYQAYVHKLAMLFTIAAGGDLREMDVTAVCYATGTVEYITKALVLLYEKHLTFGRDDGRMKKVLDAMPEGKAITRSDLLRRSRMIADDFNKIIATLITTERITRAEIKPEGAGRKKEVFIKR